MIIKADILEDSSGSALAKANDLHTIGFMERDYTLLQEELEPVTETNDAYFMYHAKVPSSMMNSVMCLDSNADFPDNRVKEIAEFLKKRGYPQLWWLGEHSTPERVSESLIECGLERVEWEIPMMAADLTRMDFSQLENISKTKNIQVRRVSTDEDLTKWLPVTQEVYKFADEFTTALGHIYRTRLEEGESASIHNFIAEIEGTPVGVSSLYLCEGLAGLYYVGTKKEYRGRGVGSAVTLAAMKEGRDRGFEVGILGASQLGFGVYQEVGFKEYYKLHLFSG